MTEQVSFPVTIEPREDEWVARVHYSKPYTPTTFIEIKAPTPAESLQAAKDAMQKKIDKAIHNRDPIPQPANFSQRIEDVRTGSWLLAAEN